MKRIIFFLCFILISFIFNLELNAKSATCVYNLQNEKRTLNCQVTLSVDNGTMIQPKCSGCTCGPDSISEANFFRDPTKGEDYACPKIYVYKSDSVSTLFTFSLSTIEKDIEKYCNQYNNLDLDPILYEKCLQDNNWKKTPITPSSESKVDNNTKAIKGELTCVWPNNNVKLPTGTPSGTQFVLKYLNGAVTASLVYGVGAKPSLHTYGAYVAKDFETSSGGLQCPTTPYWCFNGTQGTNSFIYSKTNTIPSSACSSLVIDSSSQVEGGTGRGEAIDFTLGTPKDCFDIIGTNGQDIIRLFIIGIRILAPILLFVFTAFEFMKAISSQEEEAVIKAWKRFGTRAIITVLIILLPTLMNIIGKLFNLFDTCGVW